MPIKAWLGNPTAYDIDWSLLMYILGLDGRSKIAGTARGLGSGGLLFPHIASLAEYLNFFQGSSGIQETKAKAASPPNIQVSNQYISTIHS